MYVAEIGLGRIIQPGRLAAGNIEAYLGRWVTCSLGSRRRAPIVDQRVTDVCVALLAVPQRSREAQSGSLRRFDTSYTYFRLAAY